MFATGTFLLLALAGAPATPATREGAADTIAAPKGLDVTVWEMAKAAYIRAEDEGVAQRQFLAVIDFTRPSRERRLWVVNMRNGELVANELVAHGRGSGGDRPFRFSNRVGSNQSSMGVFLTGEPYRGTHGPALKLHGLERGINDRAYARAIVLHGSRYVTPEMAERGRIGRSLGCPAVGEEVALRLIPVLADGAVLFAWYPDRKWLQKSAWLPAGLRAQGEAIADAILPPPSAFRRASRGSVARARKTMAPASATAPVRQVSAR